MTTSRGQGSRSEYDSRARATAVRHARGIEDKKRLQAQIADLVVAAYDLPSNPQATPENPSHEDVVLFKKCLGLFQTSDFNDLVRERNIDDRCGYALCPRPNLKLYRAGTKVWNQKSGKDFKLVDRSELEKWCSERCEERAEFVFRQLSEEPAWLRQDVDVNVKLLTEPPSRGRLDQQLDESFQALSLNHSSETDHMDVEGKVFEQAPTLQTTEFEIQIHARDDTEMASAPQATDLGGSVEGHRPKQVRFADD